MIESPNISIFVGDVVLESIRRYKFIRADSKFEIPVRTDDGNPKLYEKMCHRLCHNLSKFDGFSPIITELH